MLQSLVHIPANQSISVPGDKSISHRSVLFASLAKGKSSLEGFLEGEDPLHTLGCFASMGVGVERKGPGSYLLTSPGRLGLVSPQKDLDFGNAGTGIRLSCGLIAGLPQRMAILTGDASLQKRPMARILKPLTEMGAKVMSVHGNDKAPLKVEGAQLTSYKYKSPIASAQIKSALVFAALASGVSISYEEEELSRDHTENMIRFLGGKIEHKSPTSFTIEPPYEWEGASFLVPGDLSSAAFFIVYALCTKGNPLIVKNIGLNPSRIGVITVLREMGGNIEIINKRMQCGEEVGDLLVTPSRLHKVSIPHSLIPSIIDEIPILTIAGLFAEGGFSISGAEELRAKESDRITSMVKNLQRLGVSVEESPDGYTLRETNSIRSAKVETFMDHRIAMSFAILEKLTGTELSYDDTSWVDTSFPGFFNLLKSL